MIITGSITFNSNSFLYYSFVIIHESERQMYHLYLDLVVVFVANIINIVRNFLPNVCEENVKRNCNMYSIRYR